MAHTKSSPEAESLPQSLQRGKACLRCRKRKMRCCGTHPTCTQCSRAKKECEFDDGKSKTRTQILRENITRLEERVKELEDPTSIDTPMHELKPLQNISREHSGSSASSSPCSTSYNPQSPFQSLSPQSSWDNLPLVSSPMHGYPFEEEPQPPFELSLMLVDIFVPHARQCGLDIHMGRLRESLSLPSADQRHPVLMNAIYLWSCYLSRPGPLCQHESHYLSRTLEALNEALVAPTKLLDLVQATCLLSLYFLSNGRFIEGGYHLSSAAALAIRLRLHGDLDRPDIWSQFSDPTAMLLPPRDTVEEGERIMTFWQVYNMDRCWSVVLRKPVTIQDMDTPANSLLTPWPQRIEDYEAGDIGRRAPFRPIYEFMSGVTANTVGEYSPLSQRVKAATLFERANMVGSSLDPRMFGSAAFIEDFQVIEHAIAGFVPTLVPIHQLATGSDSDRLPLIVTHTLTQAALIVLYFRCGAEDPIAYEKALVAARSCVDIIKCLGDGEFELLDPIIGPCWTCATDTILRELDTVEATTWTLNGTEDLQADLGTLFYAFKSLSLRFPLLCFSAEKIEKRLALTL